MVDTSLSQISRTCPDFQVTAGVRSALACLGVAAMRLDLDYIELAGKSAELRRHRHSEHPIIQDQSTAAFQSLAYA